jgi:hypothetical protein
VAVRDILLEDNLAMAARLASAGADQSRSCAARRQQLFHLDWPLVDAV